MNKLNRGKYGTCVLIVALLLLLTGCGFSVTSSNQSGESSVQYPDVLLQLRTVYTEFDVLPRSVSMTDEGAILEVRKLRKPWEPLTADERDMLKQAIYDALGRSDPLDIVSFAIPEQADVTGKITAVDGNRILVVSRSDSANSNPQAVWVTFPPDTLGELQIGYDVNAWSDGMFNESYPAQTGGMQLQVVHFDVGEGDLQGKVTGVHLGDLNADDSYLEIDGQQVKLVHFTVFKLGGASAEATEIKVGDQVKIWLPGYKITDEKIATQVMVVK